MRTKTTLLSIFIVVVFLLLPGCSHLPKIRIKTEVVKEKEQVVKTGIEVLTENNFDILKDKKVGLITNATGINRDFVSTIDLLNESPYVKLTALYGPEHGVRGDRTAGEHISYFTDAKTNLPVYPLYGKTRKPTSEMLKDIDVLIFDIQDIGARSYTYISTMGLAMEAAAENGIEMVVLDRPNPLGGNHIEGNIIEDQYRSFVSQFAIPYVHGLTVGELASMLNDEGMLAGSVSCQLTVIPMKGWNRSMTFEETELPWVPTSPHIPHEDTPLYYVSTGILGELGVFSIGVGYTLPFRMIGAPWIDGTIITDELNSLGLQGVKIRPVSYKPYYALGKNEYLGGVQIHLDDSSDIDLMSIQFLFMEAHNKHYPNKKPFEIADETRLAMFDKVVGTSKIRELFSENYRYEDIKNYLQKDVKAFRELSKKYYLYD